MLCGVSGCKAQINLGNSAIHFANFHQNLECDKCKKVYVGVENFNTHTSVECISVVKITVANKEKKIPKKSQTKNEKILKWLLQLSEAKLDPSSTYFSLEVSTTREKCKTKVRYRSTEEAILALIRMEKRKAGIIQQLPYRCDSCKGVHNTHLIQRRILQDLITKYERLTSKSK